MNGSGIPRRASLASKRTYSRDPPSRAGRGGGAVSDTVKKRPYVANKGEQRLSIAVDRFLRRALVKPCYVTAIHDSDGGERTMQQRVRDKNRGISKGQLDWQVVQTGVYRPLELKRGKNNLSDAQVQTVADLTACGFPPIVAWTLREVYDGLSSAGFKFTGNVETVLQHCEELLAGWDRDAAAVMSGEVVKKKYAPRKAGPRFLWKAST